MCGKDTRASIIKVTPAYLRMTFNLNQILTAVFYHSFKIGFCLLGLKAFSATEIYISNSSF